MKSLVALILSLTIAQGYGAVVTYAFDGAVSEVFFDSNMSSGIVVGERVSGTLAIDYDAPDADETPEASAYESPAFSLQGLISDNQFTSLPNDQSEPRLVLLADSPDEDFLLFVFPSSSGGLIHLMFNDPTGNSLSTDNLPGVQELNTFPIIDIEIIEGTESGLYGLDVAFTLIPEPSSIIYLMISLLTIPLSRRR